jgi:hypothetical protein
MFSRKPKRQLPSDWFTSVPKKLERQMIGIIEKNRGQVLIGYHKIKFLQFMNLWKTLPEK